MTAASVEGPRRRVARLVDVIGLVPLGVALGYLIMVVVRFPRIMTAVHLNPDASWAPVLARDLGTDRGHGQILVGTAAHFATIWFLVATRWVPFRTFVWDVTPYLTYLAGLGFVAWACWRVAGRYPALLSFALGASAGGAVLLTAMSEGLRVQTYAADGVLGAFLVFWASRGRADAVGLRSPAVRPAALGAAVVGVVLVAGTTVASDPLFLASGLGPFLGAPVVLWLVRRDRPTGRLALEAAAIAAASVVLAAGVNRAMAILGYRKTYETGGFQLVPGRLALSNLAKFGRFVRLLGDPPSTSGVARSVLYPAVGLLLVAAIVSAVVLLAGSLPATQKQAGRAPGVPEARSLYLAYWVLSGLAVGLAFSVTSFADGPSDPSHYVVPVFLALAATVPLGGARAGWPRLTVAVGATLFCFLAWGNVGQSLHTIEAAFPQTKTQGPQAVDFLESQGVTTGYTGYYDSHPLTLMSDMRVHFYPVVACRAPQSPRLCPIYVNTRTNWYLTRPATRSFLLFDTATPRSVGAAPTKDFGSPVTVRQFGPLLVYIYDYDLASRLAPGCPTGTLLCPGTPTTATLTSPVDGQLGVATPARFTWAKIAAAQHYYLTVGTAQGGKDVVDSGPLSPAVDSYPVATLPASRILYVSLYTEFNGHWTAQAIAITAKA